MDADVLKSTLQPFYDEADHVGVSIYAILRDSSDFAPQKLDVEADALGDLRDMFLASLRERITDNEDLSVLALSASDERVDAVYHYDLDVPQELVSINSVRTSDNLPLLDLNGSALMDIKALLIEIGNDVGQIVLYKTMAPVNVFARAGFFLKKSPHRLERIDDEFLRLSSNFQLMQVNDDLLVLDLGVIERSFGFHEIIKKEAALGVSAITRSQLLENPDVLTELLDDVKYARRLTKIAKSSPVLRKNVPSATVIGFCKTFPGLAGRIRFNAGEDKILLDTKVSKDLFIKLLMDSFLTSELTNYHYRTEAKDNIDSDD